MSEIDKKFESWFQKKMANSSFTTPVLQEAFWNFAKEAYEQALIDVWDLPVLDVCAVAEKHGKVVKADGTVGDLFRKGYTAAEFFADPDGYDEYDLKTVVVRPDPRLHCCYHKNYHGERCVQIRKGETGACKECENIYKQVQEAKKREALIEPQGGES